MIAVFPFCGMMVFVANEGRLLFMKRYEMDLCTGALWKKILLFSVPLMFTNLLQVVFNMSDVAVVGKFAGSLRWVPSAQPASWSRCLQASSSAWQAASMR